MRLGGRDRPSPLRFKKEVFVRGPLSVRVWLMEDVLLVRFVGVLTNSDQKMAKIEGRRRGRDPLGIGDLTRKSID